MPLFAEALLNRPLADLATSWRVSTAQATNRVRTLPFLHLSSESTRGRRGRPGRRLAFDGSWRFFGTRARRPMSDLLDLLRVLHRYGEPFATGLPLTSVYLRPFLFPQVYVYAPLETVSAWRALFAGHRGGLEVVVEVLPEGTSPRVVEGLPLLEPTAAAVDALSVHRRSPSVTVLALADGLVHELGLPERMTRLADGRGLGRELRGMRSHRGGGSLREREARAAHERYQELRALPPATFADLVARREAFA